MKRIFIETPRLLLRQWTHDDIEPFCAMTADPVVMEFFPALMTRGETIALIRTYSDRIDSQRFGFFAVERKDNGAFIGFTGLSVPRFTDFFTPCIEVGWRLSPAHWNHGFATEGAIASLNYGFNTLKSDRIYSYTAVQNIRSEQVMKRIGMQFVTKFERNNLEKDHWLKTHVLYVKSNADIQAIAVASFRSDSSTI